MSPASVHPKILAKGIYLRNSLYWLRYSKNGTQYRVPLGTSDYARALELKRLELSKIPTEPSEGLQCTAALYLQRQVQLGRLSPRYAAEVETRVKEICRDCPGIARLPDVTTAKLQHYFNEKVKKWKPGSWNAWAGQVRGFFRGMVEERRLRENPMDGVKLPTFNQGEHTREHTISGATARRLIENCRDPRLKFVLLAGFTMGMRKEEIIEARWGWFDLNGRVCRIPPEVRKRSKPATPPISRDMAEHLDEMRAALPRSPAATAYILEPAKAPGKYRYRWDFRLPLDDYLKKMKVKFSPHDMRRSYCTNAVQRGATLEQLSAWVGDSVRVLAAHYAHLKAYDPLVEKILK